MLQRHDLVLLKSTATEIDPIIAAWASAGRPFIVTRQDPLIPAGQIDLALVLPGSNKAKSRLKYRTQHQDIVSKQAPISLKAVAERLNDPRLQALTQAFSSVNLMPRVYGSYAWQALTGLNYITPTSDLDLLFTLHNQSDLIELQANLAQIIATTSLRIDGELLFAGTHAVAIEEFLSAAETMLCKTLTDVSLCQTTSFYSLLQA